MIAQWTRCLQGVASPDIPGFFQICDTQSMFVIDINAVHVRPLDPVQARRLDPIFVNTFLADVRQIHVQTRPADNIENAT
jgi:hypothetical protein